MAGWAQEAQRAQFKDNYQEPQKQETNEQKQAGISQIDWFKMLQKNLEDARREAELDHLTGLPNRRAFEAALNSEHEKAVINNEPLCVAFCDLDHFKKVNDTLGHPIGDELLKAVAGRLSEAILPGNFIARIGGDEFAIVQTDVTQPEHCSGFAARLVEVVAKPYEIDGRQIVIGTSVGIAIAPNDGVNPDSILKSADMALYLAKGDGRGTHRFFEREIDKRLQSRRALEVDMRKAIANGEFEIIACENSACLAGFLGLYHATHAYPQKQYE